MKPKVSVILSVFNGNEYLKEAMDSILSQSFTDFEFIVIDDGSTDGSAEALKSYDDPRIKSVSNEENIGLTRSLNRGFEMAQGEYIARMDGDDIAHPRRLEEQVAYMDAHPDIVALGTACEEFTEHTTHIVFPYTKHPLMHARLLFNPPIAHPTAMLRTSFLKAESLRYDSQYTQAQDYDFWSRLFAFPHARGANLPTPLLRYRRHDNQTTREHNTNQKSTSCDVRRRQLSQLGITPTEQEILLHNSISECMGVVDIQELDRVEGWLRRIMEVNAQSDFHEERALQTILSDQWLQLCLNSTYLGVRGFMKCISSPIATSMNKKIVAKLFIKCILRWDPTRRNT